MNLRHYAAAALVGAALAACSTVPAGTDPAELETVCQAFTDVRTDGLGRSYAVDIARLALTERYGHAAEEADELIEEAMATCPENREWPV